MKCPKCEENNQTSRVYVSGGGGVTLAGYLPFYDEEGKYHSHDPNIINSIYTCANGHSFEVKRHNKCWCGWNKDKEDEINILNDVVSQKIIVNNSIIENSIIG